MNLDVAEVKSISHHPLPQKDSSNINDPSHDLSLNINQNSIKNENSCSIDINSKILITYISQM